MPRHRKNPQNLQKMQDFFKGRELQQNGAGASGRRTEPQAGTNNGSSGAAKTHQSLHLNSGSSSGTSSPSTRSPAKQKLRIASPDRPLADPEMEVSRPQTAIDTAVRSSQDPIAAFPTSDRPVSDTVLKEMLLSLKASLQADMTAGINKCQREVQVLGSRVDHIEQRMGEFTSSFNSMVDAHSTHDEEIAWLKNKVADLEDRSRRNNLKIRGIPETVPATQLLQYTQALFSTLLPSLSAQDLIVDRIHRLPKPAFLPENTPRDVLLRVHYYHIKEQILTTSRKADERHPQYAEIQILPDLSRHTLQQRRNLATITKALRNHHILHKWKYPAKLSITHNGVSVMDSTLEEGVAALRKWGVLPDTDNSPSQIPTPSPLQEDWQVVSRKRSSRKATGGSG